MGSLCEIGISRHWEIADADFACFDKSGSFFCADPSKKESEAI